MKGVKPTPAQALRLASKKPRKSIRSALNRLDQAREHEQSSSSMDRRHGFPRLLTAEEVADALRVNPRTLRRLRKDPDQAFPQPLLLGRAVRWNASTIANWIGANK